MSIGLEFLQLLILFFVIFDPLLSMTVYVAATRKLEPLYKKKVAIYAILVAGSLSLLFLLFGNSLLTLFNTNLHDFRIAGGIVLGLLGIKMTLGQGEKETEKAESNSAMGIASIIGTPLLTGPAAITAIIVSSADYGKITTGLALAIILALTLIIFLLSEKLTRVLGKTGIHIMSTILGLITLSWGVMFIKAGLGI